VTKSLQCIVQSARQFAASGYVPAGRWTLAQICDHLARSIERSIVAGSSDSAARKLAGGFAAEWRRRVWKLIVLRLGWIPRGIPAPNGVVPARDAELGPTIERLQAAVAAFDRHLSIPASRWPPHPYLGSFSGSDWQRMHRAHARHHFRFLVPPGTVPARRRAGRKLTSVESLESKELIG
jgi:hypothetical protein